MYVCTNVCTYACRQVCVYVCMVVWLYGSMFACVCMCVHFLSADSTVCGECTVLVFDRCTYIIQQYAYSHSKLGMSVFLVWGQTVDSCFCCSCVLHYLL